MKKFACLVAFAATLAIGSAHAQGFGTALPGVGTHTTNESLRTGSAKVCEVFGSRPTTIAASNATQAFGAVLGSTVGVGVLAKNTDSTAAKLLAGGIGGGVGMKVAQKMGSTPGLVVYLKCGSTGDLIQVVQDGKAPFVKGQTVVLEQSAGNSRIVSL